MKIKFTHANILDKNFNILKDYSLIVEGNVITKIYKTSVENDIKNDYHQHDKLINCHGNYLIPGFKNAHAHNAMTFVRSLADDLRLDVWLKEKIFPLEAKLTADDIYYFTILGIMENLTSGITACADMYINLPMMAQAYKDVGYRVNLVDGITKYDKVICPEKYYRELNNFKNDNGNLIKYTYGLHAEYTNDDSTYQLVSDLIHKYKVPFFSHNSETVTEVQECKERWGGLTPTQVNEKYGLYDYGGGGYHCIYLNDDDIEIFKKHNLTVVTNAASNLKLASGIAPIKKYMDKGLNIAIGTDGPASNNAISMFREMYLVSNLSKYLEMNLTSISTTEILKMAITNGAKCMNMEDCDSIEEGKKADIVMIDMDQPNMQIEGSFINNLVYAADKINVKMTMVDGRILYRDGNFYIGFEESWIYDKCSKLMKSLLAR